MKKTNKKQAAAWVLSLLPLVMIAAVYRRLPAEVPMHWDLDGAVDYGAKAQLWAIAATAPVLEAMFCFLPKIDPKNKNYDKFGDAYLGIQLVTLLFLAAMTGICITEALRPGTVNVSGVVCLLVSLLMVYLGNVMPRFRMNWYCGFKTPWALSSETVWTRTPGGCCSRRASSVRPVRSRRGTRRSSCCCSRRSCSPAACRLS